MPGSAEGDVVTDEAQPPIKLTPRQELLPKMRNNVRDKMIHIMGDRLTGSVEDIFPTGFPVHELESHHIFRHGKILLVRLGFNASQHEMIQMIRNAPDWREMATGGDLYEFAFKGSI